METDDIQIRREEGNISWARPIGLYPITESEVEDRDVPEASQRMGNGIQLKNEETSIRSQQKPSRS